MRANHRATIRYMWALCGSTRATREKRWREQETPSEYNEDERRGRKGEKERKPARGQHTTIVYTFRLQLASSPRAQIARVIEFSLLGLFLRGIARRVLSANSRQDKSLWSSIWREPADMPSFLILSDETMLYGIVSLSPSRIKIFGYLRYTHIAF